MTPQWSNSTYFDCSISEMVGRIFTKVEQVGEPGRDNDALLFHCDEGVFKFYHSQTCCEGVDIESITGELNDLIGSPLLKAEESTSNENPEGVKPEHQDSFTWTFYKFATIKGYVDVRWYGESNGYYSESVDLIFIKSEVVPVVFN